MALILGRSVWRTLSAVAVLVLPAAAACGPTAATNDVPKDRSEYSLGREMRYIDSRNFELTWPVTAAAAARRSKFVIVRIGEITNPARAPLTFAVAFRSSGNDLIQLGSFSLYPSDNPGRFIVATRGKVAANGHIVLALKDPNIQGMASVRVGVAELALGDG